MSVMKVPSPGPGAGAGTKRPLGLGLLLATGCGTAVASICAVGLLAIKQLVGGIWSALAVLCGGALCFALARSFARLAVVVPSSAGILAYLSRGLGRRRALLLALPYFFLSLFLVGAEATVTGILLSRLTALPWEVGSFGFLIATWALCRAGLQLGLRAQALATWSLLLGLAALSLLAVVQAAQAGALSTRIWVAAPSLPHFVAAVGQALFLFMGFELITCQADLTQTTALRRALCGSSLILTAFYAIISLGLCCLPAAAQPAEGVAIPQLAMAQASGSWLALLIVVVLSLLASYTSFNGALLTLGRLTAALASQGLLPRSLAKLDGASLLPQRALLALLGFCMAATAAVRWGGMLLPAIVAAAPAAALAYAAAAWTREKPPFCEPDRSPQRRMFGRMLALLLAALAVAVVIDICVISALPIRGAVLALLGSAYALTLLMVMAAPQRRPHRKGDRSGPGQKD